MSCVMGQPGECVGLGKPHIILLHSLVESTLCKAKQP